MEHPICPHCGDPLREVFAYQESVESWDDTLGRVQAPSGLWEVYCGDCFADIHRSVFKSFSRLIEDMRTRVSPIVDPFSSFPKQDIKVIFRKLQRQPGEDKESALKRNSRAYRHLGPLKL